jgi:hypothetical protein
VLLLAEGWGWDVLWVGSVEGLGFWFGGEATSHWWIVIGLENRISV